MGNTLNLDEQTLNRIQMAAAHKGCSAECLVETILTEQFDVPIGETSRQLTSEVVDEKLRQGGVRPGNPEKLLALLKLWNTQDFDPDTTVEEYDQILKNVDEGVISLRRVEV